MHHKQHHQREMKFLIAFLVVFMVLFVVSLINLKRGISIFGLMLPSLIENWIVMILSFLSIVKVVYHIIAH